MNTFGSGNQSHPSILHSLLCMGFLTVQAAAVSTILGGLESPSNFDTTTFAGSYMNYNIDLDSWEYDVRLPLGFDSNKTYGLITWISSGTGGTPPGPWTQALDEHEIIWVGGLNNGNTGPGGATRRGIALMGAYRMTELYNIDTNRIYASGNSGGSRAAASLTILRSDYFAGVINNVGSTFAHDLPSPFVEPNSDKESYEYANLTGIPLNNLWLNYRYFDASTRWVILTAYTDFREDDLMNIYHLGHMNFGNTVKLISRSGGHGYKEYEDFNDAINFIEHPLTTLIQDDFSNGLYALNPDTGNGFSDVSDAGASIAEVAYLFNSNPLSSLKLEANTSEAVASANDWFVWNNPYGIILDARMRSESTGLYNQQLGLHMLRSDADNTNRIGFNLLMQQTGATNKHVQLILMNASGIGKTLFEFDFDGSDEPLNRDITNDQYFAADEAPDYAGKSEDFRGLDLRVQLWDKAIQFTFGQNIESATFVSPDTPSPARLMDDNRIVQIYFDEVGITADIQSLIAEPDIWKLWFSNKALSPAQADAALVDDVTLIAPHDPLQTLVVKSAWGTPVPGIGTNVFSKNSMVTSYVDSILIGSNLYRPIGWSLSGHAPTGGNTNSFVMAITNNAILTWHWETNPIVCCVSTNINILEDAYVRDGDASNHGFETILRLSDYATEMGFVKFDVSDIDWPLVDSAVFRIRSVDDMENTSVYAVQDSSWQEGLINGLNEPAMGAVLSTATGILSETEYDFDVSGFITSNGTWTLGLQQNATPVNILENGGFEIPDLPANQNEALTNGGWSVSSVANQYIRSSGFATETGDQGVWLQGWAANQNGTFYQDVQAEPGLQYTLSSSFYFNLNFKGNGSQIDLELVWLDVASNELSRSTFDVDAFLSGVDTWENVSLSGIAVPGTAWVRSQIHWTTDNTIEILTSSSAMIDNMTLISTPTNSLGWYSRESGHLPQLILNMAIPADKDSDNDNMLDGWELTHFGNLSKDGFGDADGDTFIDLNEFLARTDPNSSASYLYIENIQYLGSNEYQITWPSSDGLTYHLLISTNLLNPTWVTNQMNVPATPPKNISTSLIEKARAYIHLGVE